MTFKEKKSDRFAEQEYKRMTASFAKEKRVQTTGGLEMKGCVLLVDDDEDFVNSTKKLLENALYEVLVAYSGKECLETLKSVKPDLIVLDIMMESLGEGYSVTHALRYDGRYVESRHIPILMVSAIQEHPAERFALSGDAGMISPDRYLTKPLDIDRFLELVGRLVRR